MKKILLGLVVVFMLSGCGGFSLIDNAIYSYLYPIEYYDYEGYDLSALTNFYQIAHFQQSHLTYVEDIGEDINSPEEAMRTGVGDCDEYAIGLINLAHLMLGIKMSLVVVNTDTLVDEISRTMVAGGIGNHFVARYDGVNYNAQQGGVSLYQEVLYEYTFEEIFGF